MTFKELLEKLTLQEKATLLSGRDFSTAAGVERLGIPPVRVADSVSGIRPAGIEADLTTASFPNTACNGSTWDAELLGLLGGELAHQARMKSAQVVLGPTINIHRDPRGGRNFECMSEDPLLSGHLAGAVVNGIQAMGVGACPKHFVCNDSERLRHFYDVKHSADSRTLREVYLAAWQHLLRTSDPVGIMTAYNKVDGAFCSENKPLMEGVLRAQWGYKGITMSDWFAVHNTAAPIQAGLDLEMPFPIFRGARLVKAVESGEVTIGEVDARVLKMLELRDRTKACHGISSEKSIINEKTNRLAWELAASGIVLLKNEQEALPLDLTQSSADTVAVIGEFARDPVITGDGSASCTPQYRSSPINLWKEAVDNAGRVRYSPGVRTRRIIPVADTDKLPLLEEHQDKPVVWMLGQFKPGLKVPGSRLTITTKLTPSTSGDHTLAIRCTGAFTLTVNSETVLTGSDKGIPTEQSIFNHILLETGTQLSMEAGVSYDIRLEMAGPPELVTGEPTPYAASLCFEEAYDEQQAIADAVALARTSDVSVIYAGRNEQYESEGFDLDDIRMPANQAALIKAVAAASKTTVLVLHCGNPIDVSAFVDDVDAVVLAHFPGQEGARAVVDVLAGTVCPSGRLATTWFKTLEDAPSFGNFPAQKLEDGSVQIEYAEGVEVGYRSSQAAAGDRVRWPFGFGLSYTSFQYEGLGATAEEDAETPVLRCSVTVKNTGQVAAKEVVQLYVSPAKETAVSRPEKELKAFDKITLQPGESRTVELTVDLKVACSYWDENEVAWRMEPGTYGVVVGGHAVPFSVSKGSSWNHL
ncbi:Beta-glucosidase like protein [Verticillium longisporum]|uniref:beta-glucosidase n=1 Tax=Verticillium longisporum TaxID=100787 RepID=A0A8I2ZVP1_VERLO|nr:Beta-glucosidase like protein [Verticillium longisporum]